MTTQDNTEKFSALLRMKDQSQMNRTRMEQTLQLRRHLSKTYGVISDARWKRAKPLLHCKRLGKNEVLHPAGKICSIIAFILTGSVRLVRVPDGAERTHDIRLENNFVTDYPGFMNRTPSLFSLVAIEETDLLFVYQDDLEKLYSSAGEWERIGRLVAFDEYRTESSRLISMLYDSPQQRYENLMQAAPHFFTRIPLYIIANYLGMTPETLSRIRQKANRKKTAT